LWACNHLHEKYRQRSFKLRDNEDPYENNNEGYTFGRIPFLHQNDIVQSVQRDGSHGTC
jgi:hypothetical protein